MTRTEKVRGRGKAFRPFTEIQPLTTIQTLRYRYRCWQQSQHTWPFDCLSNGSRLSMVVERRTNFRELYCIAIKLWAKASINKLITQCRKYVNYSLNISIYRRCSRSIHCTIELDISFQQHTESYCPARQYRSAHRQRATRLWSLSLVIVQDIIW